MTRDLVCGGSISSDFLPDNIYIYCDEAKRVLPLCFSPGICLLSVLVVIRRNELYKSLALHSHLILEGASKCDIWGIMYECGMENSLFEFGHN